MGNRKRTGEDMNYQEKKQIEHAFYFYETEIKKYYQSTVDFAESGLAVDYSRERVASSATNARETRLCGIIDKNNPSEWCNVVKNTLITYHKKPEEQIIILHYFNCKPNSEVSKITGIPLPTVYRKVKDVLETAEEWAKEFGLI